MTATLESQHAEAVSRYYAARDAWEKSVTLKNVASRESEAAWAACQAAWDACTAAWDEQDAISKKLRLESYRGSP